MAKELTSVETAMPEVVALLKRYGLEVVLNCVCDHVRPTLSEDHPESMRLLDAASSHYSDRALRDTIG